MFANWMFIQINILLIYLYTPREFKTGINDDNELATIKTINLRRLMYK